MRIKIAVLAIVAFAIAGRIFQQRNGLLAPNLQRKRGRTYKCDIQRNEKQIFADIPPFCVDCHIYHHMISRALNITICYISHIIDD